MNQTIETTHLLHAPANKVWENISKATGVNTWLPVITACRLEGNKRVCASRSKPKLIFCGDCFTSALPKLLGRCLFIPSRLTPSFFIWLDETLRSIVVY